MSSSEVFDSLRLMQAEVERLMTDLNKVSGQSPGATKRTLKRWPMQFQRSVLTTTSRLTGNVHGVAYPRNLSKSGAAVLVGSFIHPGTACHLTLRARDGTARSMAGVVKWCRHAKARAHDLGVQFETPISPREFCILNEGDCVLNLERVDVTNLVGSVLVVDEDRETHALFQGVFSASAVVVNFAKSGAEAVSMLGQSPDVIVTESTLPDMSGVELLKKIRESGKKMPVILIAKEVNDELRVAAFGGGASEVLMRPVTPDIVLRGVGEHLKVGAPAKKEEPAPVAAPAAGEAAAAAPAVASAH
jgi:CheY-like chemotaxis protein